MSEDMNRYLDVAGQVQQGMQDAEDALRDSQYTGKSDPEGVEVTINGKYHVDNVSISDASHCGEREALQQQIANAFNNAVAQIEIATRDQIAKLAKSIEFPTTD